MTIRIGAVMRVHPCRSLVRIVAFDLRTAWARCVDGNELVRVRLDNLFPEHDA